MRPVGDTFEVPLDLKQEDRMSENLPLRSRGGTAIPYNFPADGEYVVKVRLRRDGDAVNGDGNVIRGVALKRQLDVRLDDASLKLFTVGGEHFGQGGDEYSKGIPGKTNTNAPERMQDSRFVSQQRPGRTWLELLSSWRIHRRLKA